MFNLQIQFFKHVKRMINFKETISGWLQRHHEKCVAKRHAELVREANENVNVVEYNGTIYFAYKSIPLIPVDDLKGKVTDLLPKIRATFITWAEGKERYER